MAKYYSLILLGLTLFLSLILAPVVEGKEMGSGTRLEDLTLKEIYARLSKPVMLKAKVEHSDIVAPIDARLSPGKNFDGYPAGADPATDVWVQIPSWLAGLHKTETSVVTAEVNFLTGEHAQKRKEEVSRETFQYGHQVDENGKIWHLIRIPYRGHTDQGDYVQFGITDTFKCLKVEEGTVVFETAGPAVRVVKETGVIQASAYLEAIAWYRFNGTEIVIEASTKSFDEKGKPVDWSLREDKAVLIRPFAVEPDTELSFRKFMQKRKSGLE